MDRRIVSAVFDSRSQAERALNELRAAGVGEAAISVLQKGDKEVHGAHDRDDHDHTDSKGSGAAKGAAIGGGVGALAGLAALAIPGVGPFLALGAVAETLGVVGSAAATSAVVGAAAGGIAGALMKYGVDEEDARYYDKRVSDGGIWVGVDTSHTSADPIVIDRILHEAGGESARTARTTAVER